jgi:hypothetical protein
MKIAKHKLRKLIREELLSELPWKKASEKLKIDPDISTVGDLRKLIKVMQSEKRSEEGIGGLKDLGMGMLADLVPGGGTALSLAQTLKAMYSAPDDKKTDTQLDKLNVDDEVAMIVDDTVEDNFLVVALESIEGLSDEDDIPDINKALADWLRSKYDARTIAGYNEGKSYNQLRSLIRETLLNESMMRYAAIWKASNGKWYLDLASDEYGEYYDATTYGPFSDEEAAEDHLDNFSNPGGLEVDDAGTNPPPTKSPNGDPVQSISSSSYGRGSGYGSYGGFGGGPRRW